MEMRYYLYQVEYKDLTTFQHYFQYHLDLDPDEIERETYRQDKAIPKSVQYIGTYRLPNFSGKELKKVLEEINSSDRPESVLEHHALPRRKT